MIKKVLGIGIGLLALFGYNFSVNAEQVTNGNDYRVILENGETDSFSGSAIRTHNQFRLTNLGNGNWNLLYNGENYENIVPFTSNNWEGTWLFVFWNSNNQLQVQKGGWGSQYNGTVQPTKVYYGEGTGYLNATNLRNNDNYSLDIEEFYNANISISKMAFIVDNSAGNPYGNDFNSYYPICFITNQDTFYCFSCSFGGDGQANCRGGNTTQQSTLSDISISDIPTGVSVFVSGGGGTVVSQDTDVDTIINYYETRFGRKQSMCYVGTNDLISPFGTSGISFEEGTGATIFGLYYSLYSGYGSNIVKNVGTYINVGLINYYQWFYNNDNIQWIGQYNGPDQNVTYIYTGFTFPFRDKPVAYYFMSSNLFDGYSTESTQGQDMALYCYSKLNRDYIIDGTVNYEQIKEGINPAIIDRIEDYIKYEINGNNTGAYQIPNNGDFWDSFGTGEYSEIGLDNTFNNFFTRITDIFKDFSPSHSTGIIPDYILYALIFLILFRVMKH